MSVILVVSPHPDDETLGCGGTLLKHKAQGDCIFWLNMTEMREDHGFDGAKIKQREAEIKEVCRLYGFERFYHLKLPATGLDKVPMAEIIARVKEVLAETSPDEVYLPYGGDIHSDHEVTFRAAAACLKWFRASGIRRVMSYETLSETESCLDPDVRGFRPNVFADISGYLDKKIEIMKTYRGEMRDFPFPRSEEAIRALAALRGSHCGYRAAEGFMLLR